MGMPIKDVNIKQQKKSGTKYIGGRPVDRDEIERMEEVFKGLRAYVNMKMNKGNVAAEKNN